MARLLSLGKAVNTLDVLIVGIAITNGAEITVIHIKYRNNLLLMAELFLIPFISILDVHDTAIKEWLESLDTTSIKQYLDYPFRLEKRFPETIRRALVSAENIHNELLSLMDLINPQAVFLDISIDLVELENKYNNRLISPSEFWSEYYENISSEISKPAKTIYTIYLKASIDKSTRLIESKEHLPLSVVFYGVDKSFRKELIPVYEHLIDKDDEFLLQAARTMNEISPLREKPKHIWYSGMDVMKKGFSYEETEGFYHELKFHLEMRLKYRVREYVVKNLRTYALDLIHAYERFLEYKMKEDSMLFSNIMEGLNLLHAQVELPTTVIFCGFMHYSYIMNALRKEKRLSEHCIKLREIDLSKLLNKMKPFMQKNKIIESDYEIALNILKRRKSLDHPGGKLTPL